MSCTGLIRPTFLRSWRCSMSADSGSKNEEVTNGALVVRSVPGWQTLLIDGRPYCSMTMVSPLPLSP